MTEPTTEAGKRLLDERAEHFDDLVADGLSDPKHRESYLAAQAKSILAIEAEVEARVADLLREALRQKNEAVEEERARIAEAVRGLPAGCIYRDCACLVDDPCDHEEVVHISRAAVLALLEPSE